MKYCFWILNQNLILNFSCSWITELSSCLVTFWSPALLKISFLKTEIKFKLRFTSVDRTRIDNQTVMNKKIKNGKAIKLNHVLRPKYSPIQISPCGKMLGSVSMNCLSLKSLPYILNFRTSLLDSLNCLSINLTNHFLKSFLKPLLSDKSYLLVVLLRSWPIQLWISLIALRSIFSHVGAQVYVYNAMQWSDLISIFALCPHKKLEDQLRKPSIDGRQR